MMQITDTIQYDETLPINAQSTNFLTWYNENVQSKLAYDKTSTGIQPEWDDSRRPVQWVVTVGKIEVTIVWNYIKPNTSEWAKSEDTITVKTI